MNTGRRLATMIAESAQPLTGGANDYDSLMELIGDARLVLLGEASHGTHEFYDARSLITKRLIEEKGFSAIAVEADWPDAYRVNRYVRGIGGGHTDDEALSDFRRFPTWMWRNTDILDFVGWLRDYNEKQESSRAQVGFYGIDLYSLFGSVSAVLGYLDQVDPEAAQRARQRYACFESYGENSQAYGYATTLGATEPCEEEAIRQLVELQRCASEYTRDDASLAADEYFFAEQNARLIINAEEYYRSMFRGRGSSWNLRDTHMFETLIELSHHLARDGTEARIVVWAHNSHLGDARATEMGDGGELNVGQLARQHFGNAAFLVGFTTYTGTVTAASDWDAPYERKHVRPAHPESYEALFHESGPPRFVLLLRGSDPLATQLRRPRLERAIGVIYRPQSERVSHYFNARLADQFDAIVHFDESQAVEPLDRTSGWDEGEVPDTYPFTV